MFFAASFAPNPALLNKVVASNDRFVSSGSTTAQKVAKWASSTFHSLRDYFRVKWNAPRLLESRVRDLQPKSFQPADFQKFEEEEKQIFDLGEWDIHKERFKEEVLTGEPQLSSEKVEKKFEDALEKVQKEEVQQKANERQDGQNTKISSFFRKYPKAKNLKKPKALDDPLGAVSKALNDPSGAVSENMEKHAKNLNWENYKEVARDIIQLGWEMNISHEFCVKHLVPKNLAPDVLKSIQVLKSIK